MMYTGSHEGTSTNVFYRSHTNKNKKIRRGGSGRWFKVSLLRIGKSYSQLEIFNWLNIFTKYFITKSYTINPAKK